MTNDLQKEHDLADGLIQKLERIKELWAELPSEDDLEELEKHAHGLAGCLEQAREAYMDGDFPTGESLQEVAKDAAALAESVERCKRDGPHQEEEAMLKQSPHEQHHTRAVAGQDKATQTQPVGNWDAMEIFDRERKQYRVMTRETWVVECEYSVNADSAEAAKRAFLDNTKPKDGTDFDWEGNAIERVVTAVLEEDEEEDDVEGEAENANWTKEGF